MGRLQDGERGQSLEPCPTLPAGTSRLSTGPGPPCRLCSRAAVGCPGGCEGQESIPGRFVAAHPDGPLLRTAV